jgi:hypothetical protein
MKRLELNAAEGRVEPAAPAPVRIGRYAVMSWLLLVLLAWLVPPFVYGDPAYQLKALQQFLARQSPSLNHVVTANPSDLTTLTRAWISWWPPSTQLAAFPFARLGFSLGATIRIVAGAALLLGALGWARWWAMFALRPAALAAAMILLPWERYASSGLFQYSAELLAFACIPWVLLAATRLAGDTSRGRRVRPSPAFGVGIAAGTLYWVKYSSVFASVGVVLYLVACLLRRPGGIRVVIWLLAGAALPVAALSGLNEWFGGAANMLTASHAVRLEPRMLVYGLGNPALMAADLDSALQYLFTNQDHGLLRNPVAVAAFGVPGSLTLAWLLVRARDQVERLAAVTLGVTVSLMVTAWVLSPGVSFEARHVAGASMAAVPAAFAIGRRSWARFHPYTRLWLIIVATIYVLLPWTYGPVSVAAKLWRAKDYVTTNTGLYNPLLSPHDAALALGEVTQACEPKPVVWYIPNELTALEFTGPIIETSADFESLAELSARHYRGNVAICALLPPKFETNGKGLAIRNSFGDVTAWTRRSAAHAASDVWIGIPRGGVR